MSDDLNNEQILLASAYLDSDVTSAERAQVDADPQLLAEVERLRSVRTSLAATATTAISTRERHLAAALDTWDRLSNSERAGDNSGGIPAVVTDPAAAAGAATVTAPTPLSSRRNNKQSGQKNSGWLLTAAAALLVIAGGGLIARGIIDSGSDDSSANESVEIPAQRDDLSSAAADEAFADEPAGADVAADLAPQAEAALDSSAGRPDEVLTIDSPDSLSQFAREQLEIEVLLAADDASISASETFAAEAPAEATAEEASDDGVDENADLTCGLVDRIIGEAEYGTGLFAEIVAIGVDAAETEVIAYRIETCEIVARAPIGG